MDSINFIIPGLYEHYNLNFQLLHLLREHPEFFRDNVKVSAVYGSFQFCIFDGGRIFGNYRHTCKEEVEEITHIYNDDFKVPVRLVCTNPALEEKHFYNRFGNMILNVCENDLNEIVVNNEQFEEYIREHYPEYSFISSTTKCLNTPELFNQELEKGDRYKMICLDYNLNKRDKFLNAVAPENRNRCEFLVNAICPAGCSNRKEHYKLNGLFHLNYGKPYIMESCPITYNTLHPIMCNSANNITPDELYDKYVPMGFNLFKLEGRTLSLLENACNYVKYMVKPEYQFFVLSQLIEDNPQEKLFKNLLS